jgi:hypothetical protein
MQDARLAHIEHMFASAGARVESARVLALAPKGRTVFVAWAWLRLVFRRKAFVARQQRLVRAMLDGGTTGEELLALRLGDLPPSDELSTYLDRRAELGLDVTPGAPLLVDTAGAAIPAERLDQFLHWARVTRVSIEGNAGFCRGMLRTRYDLMAPAEHAASG